jgi:peroxiredoxin (alkyl hydroperoxide reductase subunit C)
MLPALKIHIIEKYLNRILRNIFLESDFMPGMIPLIGEKFPRLEVSTTHGMKVLPDDYQGKWFVLFSHPADFTPVCTTEFYAFASRYEDFKKLNTELIGLSIDSVYAHIKWTEWIKEKLGKEIPFPIIADPVGNIANKLGLIHAASATSTVRAVFIVDPQGIIRAILYYPAELGRNIDEILRMIKSVSKVKKYLKDLIKDLKTSNQDSIKEAEKWEARLVNNFVSGLKIFY